MEKKTVKRLFTWYLTKMKGNPSHPSVSIFLTFQLTARNNDFKHKTCPRFISKIMLIPITIIAQTMSISVCCVCHFEPIKIAWCERIAHSLNKMIIINKMVIFFTSKGIMICFSLALNIWSNRAWKYFYCLLWEHWIKDHWVAVGFLYLSLNI